MRKPTREEILAAAGRTLPDVIAPELSVLFCGINPSLYSAAVGHHFARPGNRFWPTLHQAGFTERLLSPTEDHLLIQYGYGLTNVVARASAGAAELTVAEYVEGGRLLMEKVRRFRPRRLAVLGVEAYRKAFEQKRARVGRQVERLAEIEVWVLPNPSGLNAHYRPADLAAVYGELRLSVEKNQPE